MQKHNTCMHSQKWLSYPATLKVFTLEGFIKLILRLPSLDVSKMTKLTCWIIPTFRPLKPASHAVRARARSWWNATLFWDNKSFKIRFTRHSLHQVRDHVERVHLYKGYWNPKKKSWHSHAFFSRSLALNLDKNADISFFLKKQGKGISSQISLQFAFRYRSENAFIRDLKTAWHMVT